MPTKGLEITDLSFVIFGKRLRLLVWQSKPSIMNSGPIFHDTLLSLTRTPLGPLLSVHFREWHAL